MNINLYRLSFWSMFYYYFFILFFLLVVDITPERFSFPQDLN